ncbi:unnamed protein product, partial [Cylicostephanus goldi]
MFGEPTPPPRLGRVNADDGDVGMPIITDNDNCAYIT